MTLVMGMLFGSWGALGVDRASQIRNTADIYAEPSILAMGLVMTFLVAYVRKDRGDSSGRRTVRRHDDAAGPL